MGSRWTKIRDRAVIGNSTIRLRTRMSDCFVVWGALAVFGLGAHAQAGTIEARGIWMHPESQFSADPQIGRQEVREWVEKVAAANFNLILPWTRSEYLAALVDAEYQRVVPIAKWDALGEIVRAASEKGIQVHLWYSFTYYKSPGSPEFNVTHKGNTDWAARRIDELIPDSATGKTAPRRMEDMSPAYPAARSWQLDLIERALQRYPKLRGVHIEEPGYGYPGNDVNERFLQLFRQLYAFEATQSIDGAEAEDLKSLLMTDFMRRLRNHLVAKHPGMALSVNGGHAWRADRQLGRDWLSWARLGWLDYYGAQVYTTDLDVFRERTRTVLGDLAGLCPVYVGIGVEWSGGTNSIEMTLRQIAMARQMGVMGILLFHGKALDETYLAALKAGPFREGAAVPGSKR